MTNVLIVAAYIVIRYLYKDFYLIITFIMGLLMAIMLLMIISNNMLAAEQTGSVVMLFFFLLVLELVLRVFADDKVIIKKD